ncbi:MAG: hypothetical protein BWY19_01160 [bacterium ADurb.Bin212]|nr:MAG: hypothetical protein BWY19_01160 [bacterium ADurb.Bin212]
MANQTNEQKQQMVNTAGYSYESLGERLNQELERASATASRVEALAPGQQATAKMIGDTSQLPSGMSPTQTIARGNMAANAFAASQVQHGQQNVIDIITKMMNLKAQEEDSSYKKAQMEISQQQAQLELLKTQKETGWTIDPTTNQPRPMTEEEKKQLQLEGLDDVTAAYLEMFQNGAMKKVSEIPVADRGKVVQALAAAGVDPEEIAKQKEGGDVSGVIKSLYDLYAVNNDLSLGRGRGFWATLQGIVGKNAPAKRYKDLKNGVLSSIRSFVGEKGIMTEPDAQRIKDLLPDVTSTDEEAILAWEEINNIFKSKYGFDVIPELSTNTGEEILVVSPDGQKGYIPVSEKDEYFKNGYKEIKQ